MRDVFVSLPVLLAACGLPTPGGSAPGCCDGGSVGPLDAAGAADAAGADAAGPGVDGGCAPGGAARHGYPADFPELHDSGGFGSGQVIAGFGGDATLDRCGHRAALRHRPVVLLHGNGTSAGEARFGMSEVRDRLRAAGWADAEIWAPSYLGQMVSSAEVPTPQRTNIADVRAFIDAVLDYLGADRVDLVGHSLGCGMANAYLRGLQADGRFDPLARRFDRVGTVVCLGGALYGTGEGALFEPEYAVGGAWVADSLTLDGVEDATPFGAAAVADMDGPDSGGTLPQGRPFHAATALDGSGARIYWVALWAIDDVVDANLKNAGGLGGADLNRGFVLPATFPGVLSPELARHARLLHDAGVVAAFQPYLSR